jgi:two-component system LytT family response regulator
MNQFPSRQIRVLVVDDEPLARQRLVDLLRKDSQVGEVLEAENGIAAVDMIQAQRPDIIFLDVQMPELDGFGVIQALGTDQMPPTIFTTAYDRYAIRAFEADASDYLLKPFSDKRYEQAVSRAKARLEMVNARPFGQHVLQMIEKRAEPDGLWDRLVVKSGGLTRFVMAAEIDWIEAAGVYVNLHVEGKEILYRSALHELAKRLDPKRFVRIHRSSVVNIECILQLEPSTHGEFEVLLKSGARLHLSRSYRSELEKRLGQSL